MEKFKAKATIILGLIFAFMGGFYLLAYPIIIQRYHIDYTYKDWIAFALMLLGSILVVAPNSLPNLVAMVLRRVFGLGAGNNNENTNSPESKQTPVTTQNFYKMKNKGIVKINEFGLKLFGDLFQIFLRKKGRRFFRFVRRKFNIDLLQHLKLYYYYE
jgi:hypothetical protein